MTPRVLCEIKCETPDTVKYRTSGQNVALVHKVINVTIMAMFGIPLSYI